MESVLSKEHKSDKLEEDLNSRCNVFVQVSRESCVKVKVLLVEVYMS